ncbi:cis-prenyltransferase [Ascosphaera atra]|nr:cis-prenyltransferase [Ascosphaera atra]
MATNPRLLTSFLALPPVEWLIDQVRELLISSLKQGPVPRHIAFVMDGNRRYARNHRIEKVEGHNLGFEALGRILEVSYKAGVKVVTIYAFSIENFKRSRYEVDALMEMAKVKLSQLAQHGDLLDKYGASVRILGRRELLKPDVLEAMDRAVDVTSRNGKCILNICFPYTSRDEITTAIRDTVIEYSTPVDRSQLRAEGPLGLFSESHIAQSIQKENSRDGRPPSSGSGKDVNGQSVPVTPASETSSDNATLVGGPTTSTSTSLPKLNDSFTSYPPYSGQLLFHSPETITARTMDAHMFTADCPPLDLLIRTSGVERLSDFMLWQAHQHTEIVFLDTLWPSFDLWTFLPVLWGWQWRIRKQGRHNRHRHAEEFDERVRTRPASACSNPHVTTSSKFGHANGNGHAVGEKLANKEKAI